MSEKSALAAFVRISFLIKWYRQIVFVAAVLSIAYATAWFVPPILFAIDYVLYRLNKHYASVVSAAVTSAIQELFDDFMRKSRAAALTDREDAQRGGL